MCGLSIIAMCCMCGLSLSVDNPAIYVCTCYLYTLSTVSIYTPEHIYVCAILAYTVYLAVHIYTLSILLSACARTVLVSKYLSPVLCVCVCGVCVCVWCVCVWCVWCVVCVCGVCVWCV